MKKIQTKRGFTLIEILVAVMIFAVVASIVVVNFRAANRRARDGRRQSDLEKIRTALEVYREENDEYPGENWCDSSRGSCGTGSKWNCGCTGSNWNGTIATALEPNFITDLPIDPLNDPTHFYYYEPACNQSDPNLCGRSVNCDPTNDCCAYELGTYLETTSTWYRVCNPI